MLPSSLALALLLSTTCDDDSWSDDDDASLPILLSETYETYGCDRGDDDDASHPLHRLPQDEHYGDCDFGYDGVCDVLNRPSLPPQVLQVPQVP